MYLIIPVKTNNGTKIISKCQSPETKPIMINTIKCIAIISQNVLENTFLRFILLIYLEYVKYFTLIFTYLGTSQSSVSTPKVDFGCKNPMFKPSAPLRGVLSIS
jgi:hypothetical protein